MKITCMNYFVFFNNHHSSNTMETNIELYHKSLKKFCFLMIFSICINFKTIRRSNSIVLSILESINIESFSIRK